jgi:hypothetical protein
VRGGGGGWGGGRGVRLFFLIMNRKRNSIDIVQFGDRGRRDGKGKSVERARGGGSRDPWVTNGRSKLDLDNAGQCVTLFSGSEKNPDYKTLVSVTVPGYSGNVTDSDDRGKNANRERVLPKAAVTWSQKRERAHTQDTKPSNGKNQLGFRADVQPGRVQRALDKNAEIKILSDGNIAPYTKIHSPVNTIGQPLTNISEEKLSESKAVFMRTGFSYEKKSMGGDSKIEITYDETDNKLLQKLNPKLNQQTYTLKYKLNNLTNLDHLEILPPSTSLTPLPPPHPLPHPLPPKPAHQSHATNKNLHNNSKTLAINNCHNIESNFSTEALLNPHSSRVSNIDLAEPNSLLKKKIAMNNA